MKNSIEILIVDNNQNKNSEKVQIIKGNNITNEVRIAVNAGHAQVILDHLHLSQRINDLHLVIILQMDTPIVDGIEFLSSYHFSSKYKKEKIQIVVLNNNLSEEKIERINKLGIKDFISDSFPIEELKSIIEGKFNSIEERKNTEAPVRKVKVRSKSKVKSIICN